METKFNKYKKTDVKKDEVEDFEKTDEVEIIQITGVISEEEAEKIIKSNENFVVHAGDFSGKEIKRGDIVWLSCLMRKPGSSFAAQSQGVLKCRITDIYLGLSKLNQLMK